MNLIQCLKVSIVFLALVTPGLGFLITGPVEGFEQTKQTDFPRPDLVILPAPESREQLADAIFERSAAKRWSIQFMNALHLYIFRFIDTDKVITGSDQWLFYKPQFEAWGCDRHEELRKKLDRFSMLIDLVTASEIPLVFALAPNKASIEQDHLGGRTARYLDCYFRFKQRFDDAVSGMSPNHFVDHSEVLSHLPGEPPTYLKFDTHWTRESGLKALNQLFESRPGILGVPLYQPDTRKEPAFMGILNKILLLEQKSSISVPVSIRATSEENQAIKKSSKVLFIYDSFYYRIMPYLVDRSPNALFQHIGSGMGIQTREKLELADFVVVEMVQRNFLNSVWSTSKLGWHGMFAEWLLEEFAEAAQQCNWQSAINLLVGLPAGRTTVKTVGETSPESAQFQFKIPYDLKPARICLRVQVESGRSGKINLKFSRSEATKQKPVFSDAFMVSKKLREGRNTLALVLPQSFRGQWIQIESDGAFELRTLDIVALNVEDLR